MAEEKKKKGALKKASDSKKKKKKKTSAVKKSASENTKLKKSSARKGNSADTPFENENSISFGHQLAVILIAVTGLFMTICFIFPNSVGLFGYGIAGGFFGLFGLAAFLVPLLLLQLALFWKRDVLSGAVKYKYLISLGVLLLTALILHTFRGLALRESYTFATAFTWENLKSLFKDGMEYQGGGFLGGILALLMICCFGYPGALIFGFLFLIALLMALFGLTPSECLQRFLFYRERSRNKRRLRKEEKERERAEREAEEDDEDEDDDDDEDEDDEDEDDGADEPVYESVRASAKTGAKSNAKAEEHTSYKETNPEREEPARKNALIIDCDEKKSSLTKRENSEEPEKKTLPETNVPQKSEEPAKAKTLAWEPDEISDEDDFEEGVPFETEEGEIMILPPDPMVEAPDTEEDEDFEELPLPPVYEFPPIDMLKPAEEINHDENVSKELRENADKIIDTLESFHVHVGISHVSRGPTVTRYELEPAAGTRVRSITNLLDDIALSLATSGVRSDGIITGKSAIGIEVPNKTVNTVYIRELIEDDRFGDAKSRLTTCLGMDVSGAPVYLDIAKMPHLLIAGATGMGKSVCINSLLVSLLYKARPDEVKLILIDPKKVELNIYNGIPHLLVPVVFDPKKAAGSLHWAVTEMERRFELIEAKNTRNISQYNAAIADDPTQEVLPQIVIIIDELADLMMSAPDDVEASICRLAQKARAAGMHLIIGTQRPSVDVITGLIKANIPSRIAFTVASQIDSRTIIDAQGAEKLIGRGDMLYAPVGAAKPIRVQGSFVSETEIEEIVGFIRSQSTGSAYSDDVMAQINRAAELCGQKKGKGGAAAPAEGGDADESDPMLDSAVALAVETGKISTSLIQRRLSLGYGRAAKIIDIMERRGIVGPPEGQKPRTVLITREQYLEMQMNKSDDDPSRSVSDEAPF